MPMEPSKELSKELRKEMSERRAQERLSLKCPVYKKCIELLDEMDALDMKHAIELLSIELDGYPEAKGTRGILNKLLEIDERKSK